jgi:Domain of unknown function (DUF4157)
MARQSIKHNHQQAKTSDRHSSGIFQRTAISTIEQQTTQATAQTENKTFHESGFNHDFSQVPVRESSFPIIQPQQRITQIPLQHQHPESLTTFHSNQTGIPTPVLRKMEGFLGQEFSNVRVQTNSPSAVEIGAQAYTHGNQLHFAPGKFQPETATGQQLLGHELTHVVQQQQGLVKPTIQLKNGLIINKEASLESEADNYGRQIANFQGNTFSNIRNISNINKAQTPQQPVLQAAWEETTEIKKYNGEDVEVTWINKGAKLTYQKNNQKEYNLYYSNYFSNKHFKDGEVIFQAENKGAGEEKLEPKKPSTLKRYLDKSDSEYPWEPEFDSNIGKRKGGGGGGNRIISAEGAKFTVKGLKSGDKNDELLKTYLESQDSYEKDPSKQTFYNRVDYGADVPQLWSTLEINPANTPAADDKAREDIPTALGTKTEKGNIVKGYIDRETLEAWSSVRKTDQNPQQTKIATLKDTEAQKVKGSPTLTAKAYGFNSIVGGKGWEWLHLRAYSMGAAAHGTPQLPSNLVLGTWHANSVHLIIESAVKWLVNSTGEKLAIEAEPELIPKTPIAARINYTISSSQQRVMKFQIDGLTRVRPTSQDTHYWKMILAARLLSYEDAEKALAKLTSSVDTSKLTDILPSSPPHFMDYEDLSEDEIVDQSWEPVKETTTAALSKNQRKRKPHQSPEEILYMSDVDYGKLNEVEMTETDLAKQFTKPTEQLIRKKARLSGQSGLLYDHPSGTRMILQEVDGSKATYKFKKLPKKSDNVKFKRVLKKEVVKNRGKIQKERRNPAMKTKTTNT